MRHIVSLETSFIGCPTDVIGRPKLGPQSLCWKTGDSVSVARALAGDARVRDARNTGLKRDPQGP